MATNEATGGTSLKARTVPVTVNGQVVELPKEELTGLQVKQASIGQGLPIDTGFQLSVKHGKHFQVVGDSDRVEIRRDLEFLAVAPDDNS